jgi:hypothetical protein
MKRLPSLATLVLALSPGLATAQRPWHARDRWQLELASGAMVFECQLRERGGDHLFIVEADSVDLWGLGRCR